MQRSKRILRRHGVLKETMLINLEVNAYTSRFGQALWRASESAGRLRGRARTVTPVTRSPQVRAKDVELDQET